MKATLVLDMVHDSRLPTWMWNLDFGDERFVGSAHCYETKGSATRAARAMANKLGLTITKTVEC